MFCWSTASPNQEVQQSRQLLDLPLVHPYRLHQPLYKLLTPRRCTGVHTCSRSLFDDPSRAVRRSDVSCASAAACCSSAAASWACCCSSCCCRAICSSPSTRKPSHTSCVDARQHVWCSHMHGTCPMYRLCLPWVTCTCVLSRCWLAYARSLCMHVA